MLYILGLGLNGKGISLEEMEIIKKCRKIYLENYTVNFPYVKEDLEKIIKKKITLADRNFVEGFKVLEKAKKKNIALLVYGSPLTATTHISLIQEARKQKIDCKIIHNASVLDAVGETGLQIYKFGKITSMPVFESESFIETVKENKKINAHSLILVDIGLEFWGALKKLERALKDNKIKVDKLVICSHLGTEKSRIIYEEIRKIANESIGAPFCFIIPAKLHFLEEEFLKNYSYIL